MIPRLYITESLKENSILTLEDEQFHYLKNVLRLSEAAKIKLFNGRDGEWEAELTNIEKRKASMRCTRQITIQHHRPPITLMFAPIKPARMDILVEKATELGVTQLQPVLCAYGNIRKINIDRMQSQVIEASEQSERLDIPAIKPLMPLATAIAEHSGCVLWADESRTQTAKFKDAISTHDITGLLIGPEGGFSPEEKNFLASQPKVIPVSLGPLILRAETAGIVMLALYQAQT